MRIAMASKPLIGRDPAAKAGGLRIERLVRAAHRSPLNVSTGTPCQIASAVVVAPL